MADEDLHAIAREMAAKYGVDPDVYERLINQESGWNPHAKSKTGAYGLTQFLPSTARDPGYGVAPLMDMEDPREQLRAGAEYLGAMNTKYNGNTARALAAYNAGPGVADKWTGGDTSSLPSETQNYIASIMGGHQTSGGNHTSDGHTSDFGGGFNLGTPAKTPEPYKPDGFDNLYAKLQGTDFGKSLGLKADGFQKGSIGRSAFSGILAGLGGMVG